MPSCCDTKVSCKSCDNECKCCPGCTDGQCTCKENCDCCIDCSGKY